MTDKKQILIQTALRLFTDKGFQSTSTTLIAKEAGVATGTLFHYFSTKEDLIAELYMACKSSVAEKVVCALTPGESFETNMKNVYRNAIYWGISCKEEFLFFQQCANSPYINNATIERGFGKVQALIDFLQEAIIDGHLKSMDVLLLLQVGNGIINALIYYIIRHDVTEEREIENLIEAGFPVFMDAIKA